MATIDNLDISIYNLYAVRTRMIEETNQQLRLREAAGVTAHTQVMDVFPKLTEIDLLLGVGTVTTPWALFLPPSKFEMMRRSPFSFSRIAPSFGPSEDHEAILEKLEGIACTTPKEKKEKAVLGHCLETIDEINSWMGYIVGRVGQFLQG